MADFVAELFVKKAFYVTLALCAAFALGALVLTSSHVTPPSVFHTRP
jgi:hypothetical protein